MLTSFLIVIIIFHPIYMYINISTAKRSAVNKTCDLKTRDFSQNCVLV